MLLPAGRGSAIIQHLWLRPVFAFLEASDETSSADCARCGARARHGRAVARRSDRTAGCGSCQRAVRVAAFPPDRTGVDVRPHLGPRRLRGESGHLLRGHRPRRCLEDHERRHHVHRPVPGPGPDVDWRRHHLAVEPGSGLGRHRRIEQPPEHVLGRRRLQVDRRGQDLRQHGPPHLQAHPPHRHRPARQQRRSRRGDGQPVGIGR